MSVYHGGPIGRSVSRCTPPPPAGCLCSSSWYPQSASGGTGFARTGVAVPRDDVDARRCRRQAQRQRRFPRDDRLPLELAARSEMGDADDRPGERNDRLEPLVRQPVPVLDLCGRCRPSRINQPASGLYTISPTMIPPPLPLVVLVCLGFAGLSLARANGIDSAASFHVATTGDDANAGTANHPFATLNRARDAVRAMERTKPVTVIVHEGTYRQTKTLELDVQDSGTSDCPVTWRAAGTEEVRIAGGPTLSATAFAPVTDESSRSRLHQTARANVLQLNVRSLDRDQIGDYPETFRGAPATPELFFNDQRMTVARWPNKGWATIAKLVETGSIPRDGDNPTTRRVRIQRRRAVAVERRRRRLAAGVLVLRLVRRDDPRQIDRSRTRQITLAAPALYGVQAGEPVAAAVPRAERARSSSTSRASFTSIATRKIALLLAARGDGRRARRRSRP